MSAEYTFVSWLRRGVAAEIAQDDDLGAHPEAGPDGRATLPAELTLHAVPVAGTTTPIEHTITRNVSILSPGDVARLKEEAILRTQPADGTLGATPGELAYVEFYDEDFPWRYTPARATSSRLRPWIALLVLTEDEFELRERTGELAVLTPLPRAVLPPHTETWAWAHAQLSRVLSDARKVDAEISSNPDHALSRLLAPRRLLPDTAYHAFLVPAFDTGRLAGLGRNASTTPAQRPAWGTPLHANDGDLPVYHRFAFTTGAAGDFETLARRLQAQKVGRDFGKRPLDVSRIGFGVPDAERATAELEAALAPPDFDKGRTPFDADGDDQRRDDLQAVVDASENRRLAANVSDDPLVVPPIYGRWHAGVPRVADASGDLSWLVELNLDLRNRAAAGLGAEVVRQRQEEYVQRAWEQVGAVEAANQRLREAELARAAADTVLRKHVAQAGDGDRILVLTAAAHTGLPVAALDGRQSIRGAIDVSALPAAAQAPSFRRITRPQRPLMQRLTGASELVSFQGGLLTAMNAEPGAALSAAPPAPVPEVGVRLQDVNQAVDDARTSLVARLDRPDRIFLTLLQTVLADLLRADPTLDLNLDAQAVADLQGTLGTRVDNAYPAATSTQPEIALADRVRTLVSEIVGVAADPPEGAIVDVDQDAFAAEFGDETAGRSLGGVTVRGDGPTTGAVVRVADPADVQAFADALQSFGTDVVDARVEPDPPLPLADQESLAGHVLDLLAPTRTIGDRLASALPLIAGRPADDPHRLAPVMAHPVFRDPMFEPLRALSQDHVIPNVRDLPRESLTLMEPNRRFIEAYLAGLNHALAQELLWREYPTDQRGTYFKVFWDTRDALGTPDRDDIRDLHRWTAPLGENAPRALPTAVLVLVIRGELLEKYPSTVIYAQEAMWPGGDTSRPRVLDPDGKVLHPVLHARLEPDITLAGFDLSEEMARGRRPRERGEGPVAPGWFFVLMERPGEPRFGADDVTLDRGLQTWNDLAWDAVTFTGEAQNVELGPNAALTPALPQPAEWGRTAADMASILFQRPVLLARHASEMLP